MSKLFFIRLYLSIKQKVGYVILNTNALQIMSCSLPSPGVIYASRFMRGFTRNTVMQITYTRLYPLYDDKLLHL